MPVAEQFTTSDARDESVLDEIKSRIFGIVFPSHWAEEGIEPPNMASKEKAFDICKHIFEKYNIVPDTIAATKEEGVFIAFDSIAATLNIEAYNDYEAGYIVGDNINKKMIISEDITELNFYESIKKAVQYIYK
ncbi:MAG: hypothetical protein L7F77_10115 [Candidatus Magnetominusculus sp. LBB02]|nr:hypothetical protein [Candidatus Magnetominusculus sp. LBB02]